MGDLVAIYALCEPDTGEVRYVGKAKDPTKRLETHLAQAASTALRTHKGNWLASLKAQGHKPKLQILEWVSAENWQDVERYWIKQMRAFGCDLTNGTDGGDGGYSEAAHTPEARAKRSASLTGRPRPPEVRVAIGIGNRAAHQRDAAAYANCPAPPVRRGEDNNKAKLTDTDVFRLRELHAEGVRGKALAQIFGITPANAWMVATGRTWSHLPLSERG